MILRTFGGNAKTCITAVFFVLVLFMTCVPISAQEIDEAESQPAQAAKPTGAPIIDDGSPGMYIKLDGNSVRKFENGLEEVQAQTTEAEYTTVQNALDYLLVYDLSARRDKKVLYKNLDGMTPAEIVGMVKWRLEGRGRYHSDN